MSTENIQGLVPLEGIDADKLLEQNQELLQQNKNLKKEIFYLREKKFTLQSHVYDLENKCLSLEEQLNNSYQDRAIKHHEVAHNINIRPVSSNSVSEVSIYDLQDKVKTFDNAVIELENSYENLYANPTIDSKFSKYSFKQRNQEVSILEALNLFNVDIPHAKNVGIPENKNVFLLQNKCHINELLLEIKTVIEDIEDVIQKSDVRLAMPHIARLKRIRNCLEKTFHDGIYKSKNYLNFDNFAENCVICIKKIMSKQESIIDSLLEKTNLSVKDNESLHSNIVKLKKLLLSCGFLKPGNEEINKAESLFSFDAFTLSNFNEVLICDIAHEPLLKRIIVPLLPILNLSFSKLVNLHKKMVELQHILDCTEKLNVNLINRVHDQEVHLKGVTKEIEEAQHIVSVIKNEHKKLQYAEGILKYDLQEKRKLLTRLREQLENTRENFSLVRIKNSQSEAEWQDLHNEFLMRQKQSTAENDYPNDKCLENHDKQNNCDNTITSTEYLVNDLPETISSDVPPSKTRLELLEEQCQNLYSSLLQSTRKRHIIDEHLENLCQRIEKKNKIRSDNFAINCLSDNNDKDIEIVPLKSNCESIIFECNEFANSSDALESLSNQTMLSNNSDLNSSKTDSCVPCLSEQPFNTKPIITTNEKIHENNFSSNSVFISNCGQESNLSRTSIGLTGNDNNIHVQCKSPDDSVLIKKVDVEKCLNLEIDNKGVENNIRC